MIQIKPVSDLRNKSADIERIVNAGEPVYLTKNVYRKILKNLLHKTYEYATII